MFQKDQNRPQEQQSSSEFYWKPLLELLSVQHALLKAPPPIPASSISSKKASLHSCYQGGTPGIPEPHGEVLILKEKQLPQGPGLQNLGLHALFYTTLPGTHMASPSPTRLWIHGA